MSDTIPDEAQCLLFVAQKEWVPNHPDALEAYSRLIGESEYMQSQIIVMPWFEFKDGGFSNVSLPDQIRELNIYSWMETKPRPILLHLLLGAHTRWDEDGAWIY